MTENTENSRRAGDERLFLREGRRRNWGKTRRLERGDVALDESIAIYERSGFRRRNIAKNQRTAR